jgi:hypothetical protein
MGYFLEIITHTLEKWVTLSFQDMRDNSRENKNGATVQGTETAHSGFEVRSVTVSSLFDARFLWSIGAHSTC